MDTAIQYAKALHPRCHTVAGVRLRPFTLGHALLLTRLDNPIRWLWSGDDERIKNMAVGAGDVAQALWVCSRPATTAMDRVGGWLARWQLRRLGGVVVRNGVHASTVGLLDYVAEGFTAPKLKPAADGGGSSQRCGAPLLAMVKATLVAHFGRTDAQALNTPLALALWDRAAFLEEQGFVRFWTDDDEDLMDWARELAADPDKAEAMFKRDDTTTPPNPETDSHG